jgi:hypothetical protein
MSSVNQLTQDEIDSLLESISNSTPFTEEPAPPVKALNYYRVADCDHYVTATQRPLYYRDGTYLGMEIVATVWHKLKRNRDNTYYYWFRKSWLKR